MLDGAILVLCSVGGVQSQSLTVDRQMKRYQIPRIAFINKCDRTGADPFGVAEQMAAKLHVTPVPLQIPIGLEDDHEGVVDLVAMKAYFFDGEKGRRSAPRRSPRNCSTRPRRSGPRCWRPSASTTTH